MVWFWLVITKSKLRVTPTYYISMCAEFCEESLTDQCQNSLYKSYYSLLNMFTLRVQFGVSKLLTITGIAKDPSLANHQCVIAHGTQKHKRHINCIYVYTRQNIMCYEQRTADLCNVVHGTWRMMQDMQHVTCDLWQAIFHFSKCNFTESVTNLANTLGVPTGTRNNLTFNCLPIFMLMRYIRLKSVLYYYNSYQ